MKTWDQTIAYIRTNREFEQLVKDAYFSTDLVTNVENYRSTLEFKETLRLIKSFNNEKGLSILDLGAGNGISSIAFALEGYKVTSLEPDLSETIGIGAIKILAKKYGLENMSFLTCYAEDIPAETEGFDIVFSRQAMHHAYNLNDFVAAAFRVLKNRGFLVTIRDHVVESSREKAVFLENHPLHKFYGGENAFSKKEYVAAMEDAGFKVLKKMGPEDSPINYAPWTKEKFKELVKVKLGYVFTSKFIFPLVWKANLMRLKLQPGRLYSFVAQK